MEAALYHPEHGYYASGKARIGRDGDFYTSVSAGSLFGELIGMQVLEIWNRMDQPAPFTLVEQGANDGRFARDLLTFMRENAPELSRVLHYRIVEPFPILRERQQATIQADGSEDFTASVDWISSLDELEPFTGVHFSNELLDAMPVHLVRFDKAWRERYVGLAQNEFTFVDESLSNQQLEAFLPHLPAVDDYVTELNLAALSWVNAVAAKLLRGVILTIDYGFPRHVYYSPERSQGTLSCYSKHQRSYDPLKNPGSLDLTAHVEFTSLAEQAERAGLQLIGFTDQHHFLVGIAKDRLLAAEGRPLPEKTARAFKTLMHPSIMGMQFQVLGLEKNAPAQLSGFQFGGDARNNLGL
jgi:SAM-dependent MidA family methyltransferase